MTALELSEELLVGKFGTYNIDRFLSRPAQFIVEKSYEVSSPSALPKGSKVYLVVSTKDGLVPVDLTIYPNQLRFNKAEKNALIAITNEKVYGLKKVSFEETAKSQIKLDQFSFALEEMSFTNPQEFDASIGQLFL